MIETSSLKDIVCLMVILAPFWSRACVKNGSRLGPPHGTIFLYECSIIWDTSILLRLLKILCVFVPNISPKAPCMCSLQHGAGIRPIATPCALPGPSGGSHGTPEMSTCCFGQFVWRRSFGKRVHALCSNSVIRIWS